MVKASVFPGTPRAGYGPRRATLQEDRPGAYRDRRTLPTRELQTAPTSVLCVRRGHERPALPGIIDRHRPAPGGQGPHARGSCRPQGGAQKRAGSTPRVRETHRDSAVTPRFVIHAARPGNEGGGSGRRRHFPHASAQPRIRLAPSIPLLPCPQKNSCGTNVFGTSFPLNTHENPQQNLPDALTENRYFTRTKVY